MPQTLRRPSVRAMGLPRLVLQCLVLVIVATGCARPAPPSSPDDRPHVLTTFSVLADLVDTVGGGHVRVESITKVGAEIHGYEPTPSDLVRAQDADLILDNGLGLERWFERFLNSVDAPHAVLSDGVEPIAIQTGDYRGRANPHAWMSPVAAQVYVDNTVDALSGLAPEHAEDFEANGRQLKADLAGLLTGFREDLGDADAAALVTCEGAFSYLARDAGLDEAFIWPVNADAEGTPRQIRDVITFVEENRVPTLFCESTVNPSAQEQVALATGAQLGGTLYVDSLSGPGGPVPTFVDLIEYDLHTIAEGLTR
ncbi:metal ABC transporter substrate-binding protein [Arthrobacter pityocampae]|uniref:Metal ABC transporter substrate-binding protein n=1 Tax=Arthrobacter pityocampae TaxID=547334 RepID=A0A2S5J1S7_9MICC|nr:metal ABC transporter substrate-binding protein [Arthrobacter pityocampae]PPB50754.1 metal ABC transporter substrate-binding protein [Arthrobacter pityocampae]